jgi:glycogen debranching enzyme
MSESSVRILAGNNFLVCGDNGDIEESPSMASGLFSFDTRFLSTWVLTVNGQRLQPLAVDDLQHYESRFFLVQGEASQYVDARLSVIRHRWIGASFQEQLTIINHDEHAVDATLRIDAASDFADLLEIKNVRPKKGNRYARVVDGSLVLGYERGSFRRETVITPLTDAEVDERGLTFHAHVDPQHNWTADVSVKTRILAPTGNDIRAVLIGHDLPRPQLVQALDEWVTKAPRLDSDWDLLVSTYRRSLMDLAALRFAPLTDPGHGLPAAGLPWYMTIFGRDSIIASLQSLPFYPELAETTLKVLGSLQGSRLDDFREEEPGKIMHEFRYGESAAFEEQPHSPYFGAADTSALYVILLDEYERWSGDGDLVRALESRARAALDWIDGYADLVGDGYVWYERRNLSTGLENQCWKDSNDSISYSDGRIPGTPRATCELQGYAYDAKVRGARLARLCWGDPGLADRLEREAADLKERFNRDFWIEDRGYYALALDADGGRVDALSSNIGHLLWSGIVDRDKAPRVVEHLMGPRLFSGWGVRTLAVGEARYNPVGYHVGTVWPFDNSFIAWGLRSYGFRDEAARIAQSVLESAEFFQGRLPEAFAGYERELTRYPVQYPTACSPQAWSTGAPLLLLRTMLGLEPLGDQLTADPALPSTVGWIGLLDVPGRWGRFDAFGRGRAASIPKFGQNIER